MVVIGTGPSGISREAVEKRLALTGTGGPAALIKNIRVFGIACFACIGKEYPKTNELELTKIRWFALWI
jgi:hypothetical protein